MWTIVAAVLIAVALYVVENYGGNGFVPSWDQIYQWVGLEPSQSETTAPLPEGETEVVFLDVGQGDAVLILQNGAACLIDAGPKDARQNLVQDLRSYGVRVGPVGDDPPPCRPCGRHAGRFAEL